MSSTELGKVYWDGEIICREGDRAASMFVIQSGKVDIIKNMPEGEIKLTTLKAGEIFGEMSLFDNEPRSATARASGEATVLTIDKEKFFAKASSDPTLAFNILRAMSRRIRALNEELARHQTDGAVIY